MTSVAILQQLTGLVLYFYFFQLGTVFSLLFLCRIHFFFNKFLVIFDLDLGSITVSLFFFIMYEAVLIMIPY